jgi:RNA polymerase sigma-70 factor (ECF subfamily)
MTSLAAPMTDPVRAGLRDAMQRSYVVAYRLLGDADAARDACQEAALKALSASARYDASRPFYPWFYRILKNHCLDRIASNRRVSTSARPERVAAATAERELVDDERIRAVARAIEGLSDEHREIVELRHFSDLPYDDIAEVLDIPVGTVMSRLYRARKRMREILMSDPAFTDDGDSR